METYLSEILIESILQFSIVSKVRVTAQSGTIGQQFYNISIIDLRAIMLHFFVIWIPRRYLLLLLLIHLK